MFIIMFFFFFKQKTAYEMRISDWSSDVCSSDLAALALTLQFLAINQRFSLTAQALLHFAVDLTALGLLVYTTGGVGGGLGILLVPPLVGCSLVLTPRLGLVFAATATLTIFGEETLRQLPAEPNDSGDFPPAGQIGRASCRDRMGHDCFIQG